MHGGTRDKTVRQVRDLSSGTLDPLEAMQQSEKIALRLLSLLTEIHVHAERSNGVAGASPKVPWGPGRSTGRVDPLWRLFAADTGPHSPLSTCRTSRPGR